MTKNCSRVIAIVLLGTLGCGGTSETSDGASDTSTGTTTTTGPVTATETPTTTEGTTESAGSMSDSESASSTTSSSTTTTGPDPTTGPESTTTTTDTGDTTTDTADTTTGEPVCMEEVAQSFVPTGLELDMESFGSFVQGSWYDPVADTICFVRNTGLGRCYEKDGTSLEDIQLPYEPMYQAIDGAIYDAVNDTVLMIQTACVITEVDPNTLQEIGQIVLDKQKLGLDLCAGIALIPGTNDLYVNSLVTDEIVKISRDGTTELGRIDLAAVDIDGPDAINVISGLGDLLVIGVEGTKNAGIISSQGDVIVPAVTPGGDMPPIKGGNLMFPDDALTLCQNGHVWVCDQTPKCVEYMPEDGDKNICGCFDDE